MEQLGKKGDVQMPRCVGDPSLLEFKMSGAAERYGVSATVIPHRIRRIESGKVNG